jgi:L-ascorbate metabolism protein UlaG (beta-lactamase superfamily)
MTKQMAALFLLMPFCFAQTDRIGDIEVTPITHASVQLEYAGKVIQIDPWSKGDYSQAKQADLILVTGAENDHFDLVAIRNIRKPGAPVVIPAVAKEKLADGTVIANGETKTIAGIRVEAIAAYDLIPGEPFHPKGRGNSYIITLGGKRLFFSGVTECVLEMQSLKYIDGAFLSMNLPHGRMTPAAAADCVKIFKPRVVYPYHYREGKVMEFRDALKGEPIEVRLRNWYPAAAGN